MNSEFNGNIIRVGWSVCVVSTEEEPWMFDGFNNRSNHRQNGKPPNSKLGSRQGVIPSASTYLLPMPCLPRSSTEVNLPFANNAIVDGDDDPLIYPAFSTRPLLSATLALSTSLSYQVDLHACSRVQNIEETFTKICHAFSQLAMLGEQRWQLPDSPPLPAHLSAISFARSVICTDSVVVVEDHNDM